ncbi:hypothetical protein D3C79_554550 [compost metagenome]
MLAEGQGVVTDGKADFAVLLYQFARLDVHFWRPDKAGDKHVFRVVVQVVWRIHLHDMAQLHHADTVAHGHGFGLIVGNIDGGRRFAALFQLLVQIGNTDTHRSTQLGIQVRQRFIEQEHVWFFHNCAAHGHTLRLPTRELAWQTIQQLFQLQDLGGFVDLLFNLLFRQLAQLQTKRQVIFYRHMRIQRIVLEHHGNTTGFRGQVIHHAVANAHFTAANGFQPCQHPQRGRFGTAGRADNHHKLAIGNGQIDAMYRLITVAVHFLQIVKNDFSHDRSSINL